jgi:deferrochelatase/peroxidase EfeB
MTIDVADVQGIVINGYGPKFRCARHFFLAVGDAADARAFLRKLLEAPDDGFAVTTGERWPNPKVDPPSCLNVGFTWSGLQAIGVAGEVLNAFPDAYRQGPAARAKPDPNDPRDVGLGDVGKSDPKRWIVGGPKKPDIHLIVSLYARRDRRLEEVSARLRTAFVAHRLNELYHHDAQALASRNGMLVHFGYRDGIAQPRLAGGVGNARRDMQPDMPTGDLLLGCDYCNSFRGNYAGGLPGPLVDNATYGAFRILEQDVVGFDRLIRDWSKDAKMSRELVAAKLMGRWRNGVPLALSPHTDRPNPPLPEAKIDDFDYAPGRGHPKVYDDAIGLHCPIGAHIRRLNPRGGRVMGKPHSRRLVRRNMTYGGKFDPRKRDTEKRGLVGYFLCADLEAQWEFIQRIWVNQDLATSGIRGTREPIGGTQPRGGGKFTIRTDDARDPIELRGLQDLVTTRGSAYCLLPGIGGLRYLASLGGSKAGAR